MSEACSCEMMMRMGACECAEPHPLVALLTEALAVTDPKRPPESVVLMDGDVLLEWVKPTAEVVWDGHAFAGHSRQARLTTSDPAEARAWLAAALEAT